MQFSAPTMMEPVQPQPQIQMQQYAAAPTAYEMPANNLQTAQSMLMAPGVTPQFQFTPGASDQAQQAVVPQAAPVQPDAAPVQMEPERKPATKAKDKKKTGKTKKTCC